MCLTEGKQKANHANGNANCNGNGVKSNGYNNNHSSSNNDVVISLDR